MSTAESTRINDLPNQYIRVRNSAKNPIATTIDLLNFFSASEIANPEPSPVLDSDGESLVLGKNYVVFVMAVYTDDYKREINNFDDFLSAPSREFLITNTLAAVDGETIAITEISKETKTEIDIKIEVDFKYDQNKTLKTGFDFTDEILDFSEYTNKLTFSTPANERYSPVHRCIFLPANPKLDEELLTSKSLKKLLKESGKFMRDKERASNAFKSQILKFESDLKEIDAKEKEVKKTLTHLASQLKADPNNKDAKKWQAEQTQANQQLVNLEKEKIYFNQMLKKAQNEEQKIIATARNEADEANLHFFFNLAIAEQVSVSNYTKAKGLLHDGTVDHHSKPEAKTDTTKDDNQNIGTTQNWIAFIGPETTDNFGNSLIDGNTYYAVILTLSSDEVDNPYNYTNALSDIYPNCKFKFKASTSKK